MKRRILVYILALFVLLAGVRLGVSYFSDVAKSKGNSLSTGDFDIGISKDGKRFYDELRVFSFKDVAPGDAETFTFYIKNRGDYPVSSLSMVLNVTDLEDGPLSKAEKAVDTTPDRGELSEYLVITDFRVELNGNETVLTDYIGKRLRDLNMTTLRIFSGSLKPGEVLKVTMTFRLSPEAGNECLTDTSEVDMTVTATQ